MEEITYQHRRKYGSTVGQNTNKPKEVFHTPIKTPAPTVTYYKGVETIHDVAAYQAYLERNGYRRG